MNETEQEHKQEWVSVHKHLDEMFEVWRKGHDKIDTDRWTGHDRYHTAIEEARQREAKMLDENLKKAMAVLDERFANTNEWRATLNDVMVDLVRRVELKALREALEAYQRTNDVRVSKTETTLANVLGRGAAWGAAAVIGLGILQLWLKFTGGP